MQLIQRIAFATFAFMTLSAEECGKNHFISDSGFDLWCGDSLCNWEVESGSVVPVGSWHKGDLAMEMLGNDVRISQLSTRGSTSCLRFEVLADIDDDARVTLSMDFYDDGVIDYEQELGHVRWESLVHLVATPATWTGVRFALHKEGPGRVRLAQIEATADTSCIDKPIELIDKPLGAFCVNAAECASGSCAPTPVVVPAWLNNVCSGCAVDQDCEPGFVCGASSGVPAFLLPPRACLPEASRANGTLCVNDSECSSGVCCYGRCSECCSAEDCPRQEICEVAGSASLCSGNESGAACFSDADCDSQRCKGGAAVRACEADGRDCRENTDCPADSGNTPLCVTIGSASAHCQ